MLRVLKMRRKIGEREGEIANSTVTEEWRVMRLFLVDDADHPIQSIISVFPNLPVYDGYSEYRKSDAPTMAIHHTRSPLPKYLY